MTSQFIKLTVVSCILMTGTSVLAQTELQTQTGLGGGSINRTEISSVEVGLAPNVAQFVENYSLTVLQGYENETLSYSNGREDVADELRRKLGDPQILLGGEAQTVALVGDSGSGRTFSVNQFIYENPTYDVFRIRIDLLISKIPDQATQAKTLKEILISLRDKANKSPGGLIVYLDKVSALNVTKGVSTLDTIKELVITDNAPPMILEMNQGTYNALTSDKEVKNRVRYVNNPTPPSSAVLEHLRSAKARAEARYKHVNISEAIIEQIGKIAQQYLTSDTFRRAEDLLWKVAYAVENELYSEKISVKKLKQELASTRSLIRSLEADQKTQSTSQADEKLGELKSKESDLKAQIANLEDTRIVPLKSKISDLEKQKADQISKLDARKLIGWDYFNAKKSLEIRTMNKEISRLSYELERAQNELSSIQGTTGTDSRPIVQATAMDVKKEAEKMLKISLTDFAQAAARLLEAKDRIFNQDHIIDEVARALGTAETKREMKAADALREGKQVSTKPILSAILFGETGTGKTELAKEVAHALGYDKNPLLEQGLIRINMNEYQESHSTSRLIGPPPGYVGFDSDNETLADILAKNPNSVLLLDELEKAHPKIMEFLMTALDEGYITSSKGEKVYLTNTVILASSNLGEDFLDEQKWPTDQLIESLAATKLAHELPGDGDAKAKLKKMNRNQLVLLATKNLFIERYGAAVVARFDKIFSSNSHTAASRQAVVSKILSKSFKGFSSLYQIEVRMSESAFEHIVGKFVNSGGARSAINAIESEIQERIIELAMNKQFVAGDVVVIHNNAGNLEFTVHSRQSFELTLGSSKTQKTGTKASAKLGIMDSILETAKDTSTNTMQKSTRGFTEKFMIRDAVAGALRKLGR